MDGVTTHKVYQLSFNEFLFLEGFKVIGMTLAICFSALIIIELGVRLFYKAKKGINNE